MRGLLVFKDIKLRLNNIIHKNSEPQEEMFKTFSSRTRHYFPPEQSSVKLQDDQL